MQHPFWFLTLMGILAVSGGTAGYLQRHLLDGSWVRQSVQWYGVPGFILVLYGQYQAADINGFQMIQHCRTESCRLDVFDQVNWMLTERMGLVGLAVVALCTITALCRQAWLKAVKPGQLVAQAVPSPLDPNKWRFEPETGEWRRIAWQNKGYAAFTNTIYADRLYHFNRKELGHKRTRIVVWACWLATVLFFLSQLDHGPIISLYILIGMMSFSSLLSAWLFIDKAALYRAKQELGVPPGKSAGQIEVEGQQAYGTAGIANAAAIHAALSGTRTAAHVHTASLGPIFED